MKANLLLAQQNWDRAQKLGPSDALAPSAYDQYKATFEVAKANLGAAVAAVEQAKASRGASSGRLKHRADKPWLLHHQSAGQGGYYRPASEHRPDRRFLPEATSLFLLAKDLKRITVWVSVNEADLGSIFPASRLRLP